MCQILGFRLSLSAVNTMSRKMNVLSLFVHLPNLPTLLVISRFDTILPSKNRGKVRPNPFPYGLERVEVLWEYLGMRLRDF